MLQARQQHSRFIQAIQTSPNGVLMLDDENRIEQCNVVAEEHFGLFTRRNLRQRITHLIHRPEFVHYLARGELEEPLTMHDVGPHKQSIISAQILPYGEGHKLLVSQNIIRLESIETIRCGFVASISHKLKTLLTVLSGFLETVRGIPPPGEDKRRCLGMTHTQTTYMQYLVEDLLTLITLGGSPEPPPLASAPMQHIMLQLRRDIEALSADRHTVNITCDPVVSVCDAELELLSASDSLTFNAVHYTSDGGSIQLGQGVCDGHAVYSVADAGIGITPRHVPRLTKCFYRINHSRSRDANGTGLGLATVERVLSRHDGELQMTNKHDEGDTFRTVFPSERAIVRSATMTNGRVV